MSAVHNPLELPPGLPRPLDDGACGHLIGMAVPSIALNATDGQSIDLSHRPAPHTIVYCYPRTGRPGVALPTGWDQIPGARGCTPESCSFRDHHRELLALGAEVFGLSTQDGDYQREAVDRLHLSFPLLSDEGLQFTRALSLPTFEVDGMTLIKRLTLVLAAGRIEHVFYPIFPPDRHAEEVIAWLNARRPAA
jgi:peroxiredoxin